MVNWITFIIIAVLLVAADKGLTYLNIKAVERVNPLIDPITIEKNPVARSFFYKFGLIWGSVLFGIISLVSFFAAMSLLYLSVKWIAPLNPWGISLYIMCLLYGFVIMNNVYMLLKHSQLL